MDFLLETTPLGSRNRNGSAFDRLQFFGKKNNNIYWGLGNLFLFDMFSTSCDDDDDDDDDDEDDDDYYFWGEGA